MRDLSALPNLNIALVQTTLAWHDRQANLEHFDGLLEQARGADLIILPEMFTTGFSMDSRDPGRTGKRPDPSMAPGPGGEVQRGDHRQRDHPGR